MRSIARCRPARTFLACSKQGLYKLPTDRRPRCFPTGTRRRKQRRRGTRRGRRCYRTTLSRGHGYIASTRCACIAQIPQQPRQTSGLGNRQPFGKGSEGKDANTADAADAVRVTTLAVMLLTRKRVTLKKRGCLITRLSDSLFSFKKIQVYFPGFSFRSSAKSIGDTIGR